MLREDEGCCKMARELRMTENCCGMMEMVMGCDEKCLQIDEMELEQNEERISNAI